mgnify:CR=1 FL=1|jgi:quercetin dioxygenase-like cupin family protein
MKNELVIVDSEEVTPRLVVGEEIRVLVDHEQTGSYEIYQHDAPEGAGPPPHYHAWDEAFYVIEGAVDFVCGSTSKTVKAGGFVHVPAGTVHSFRYASETARMLGITSTGGAAAMFSAVDEASRVDPSLANVVATATKHGLNVVS